MSEELTHEQIMLKKKHGTPEEFKDALIRALGEISIDEMNAAFFRYETKWNRAGKK